MKLNVTHQKHGLFMEELLLQDLQVPLLLLQLSTYILLSVRVHSHWLNIRKVGVKVHPN